MRAIYSCVLILAATAAVAQPNAGMTATATPDIRPFVAREISSEVHALVTPADYYGMPIGNVVIIEQSRGVVVVDSGGNIANGRAVANYVRSLTQKPVTAVVLTHWHNDHPLGLAALKQQWPQLRVISTAETKTEMAEPGLETVALKPSASMEAKMSDKIASLEDPFRSLLAKADTPEDRKERLRRALVQLDAFNSDFRGTYAVLPTETFRNRMNLADSKVPIELHFFGNAHTKGDLVVWLPRQKIVATGDIVASPIPFGYEGYPAEWLQVLNRVKGLGFRSLVPGHGEPMPDASYVDRMIASLSTIRDKVGPLAKAGMAFKDIKANVDLSSESDRFGTTPRLKAGVPTLWTDPMTINVYMEAKGLPIPQIATAQPEPK